MLTHGGFKVGDYVQVKVNGKWELSTWKIVDFKFLRVQIQGLSDRQFFWMPIHNIRHPHLVRRKHG